ncbi:MAG: FG-GAP repeat domain-containing protein [Desulfuromonadales bacterium]
MPRFMRREFMPFILCLAIALLPSFATAQTADVLNQDFKPLTASLVMPLGSDWIIDQDATQGVKSGDLFSVVDRGKPVVHPVTKEVLGSIEVVRGILQVTNVKTGYSYARVLSADEPLSPGDQLQRFYNLPASFWDYTDQGEALFVALQAALPDLEWQPYTLAQQARPAEPTAIPGETQLLFILTDQGLAVKDNALQPIRFYSQQQLFGAEMTGSATSVAGTSTTTGIIAASPQAAALPNASSGGLLSSFTDQLFGSKTDRAGAVSAAKQTQRGGLLVSSKEKREGVWYGPHMQGQPVGLEVADFDGDGKQEVAIAFTDRIVVGRIVDGRFEQIASLEFDRLLTPLSLDGIDLNHDGKVELYVTAVYGFSASSSVLELHDGQLDETINNIPWLMRKVVLPGEGEVLLGQTIDPDSIHDASDYTGPIFRIARTADELSKAAEINVPRTVEVNGFLPIDVDGRRAIVNIDLNDKLLLLEQDGSSLWESSDYYGGSKSFFKRKGQVREGARYRYLKQRIEPGPDNTVLVPVNKGSRLTSFTRKFNQSHLEALSFDGYSMVERWRTQPQGGYMADYRMADVDNDGANEIVVIVQFSQGSWSDAQSGNSALIFYEMQ